jgi:hypothetical protein
MSTPQEALHQPLMFSKKRKYMLLTQLNLRILASLAFNLVVHNKYYDTADRREVSQVQILPP